MQLTFLFIKLPLAPNTRLTSPDQNFLADYFKVLKYHQLLDPENSFSQHLLYIFGDCHTFVYHPIGIRVRFLSRLQITRLCVITNTFYVYNSISRAQE